MTKKEIKSEIKAVKGNPSATDLKAISAALAEIKQDPNKVKLVNGWSFTGAPTKKHYRNGISAFINKKDYLENS